MKYQAVCPNCNHHFSRIYFSKTYPGHKRRCPACDVQIKLNSLRCWVFSVTFAIPFGILFCITNFKIIPPLIGFLIMALYYTVGVWIFPFVNKIDLVETTPNDSNQSD